MSWPVAEEWPEQTTAHEPEAESGSMAKTFEAMTTATAVTKARLKWIAGRVGGEARRELVESGRRSRVRRRHCQCKITRCWSIRVATSRNACSRDHERDDTILCHVAIPVLRFENRTREKKSTLTLG
jgi:hypothetical protein